MIRTRDVVVFAGIVLFLCVAIAVTLIVDMRSGEGDIAFIPYFEIGTSSEFIAEAELNTLDRQGIIAHLREALGQHESSVIPSPSVEEAPAVTDTEDGEPTLENGVMYCGGDDTDTVMRSWPLSGVQIIVENGFRKAVHTTEAQSAASVVVATTTSSSTAETTPSASVKTLISFSASPVPAGSASCVPGEVIGITTNGSLMYNSEASFYRGYGSEYLIGYARDGFPVYGYYEGETDPCGGYMHPSGYRYSVTQERDVVLNCFTATPSSFSM